MAEMQWTEKQIGAELEALHREYGPHMRRMRIRRMLLEMASDATNDQATGTHVPPPYDKSRLILKTLIGDAQDVVQNYTARMSANEPQVSVIPVSLHTDSIGKTVERNAAEQERLLTSQWDAAGGRAGQRQVTYSQAWGRVGWYLTLPRDTTWGLPAREYYTDLTDDEIAVMTAGGKIVPNGDDGFKESGQSWMERRRKASAANATSHDGRALFTLEAYPSDMVYPRYDRDGSARRSLKHGFVVEEIPASEFRPGSDLAKAAATHARKQGAKIADGDIHKYGLTLNAKGEINGAVTRGGEAGSTNAADHWILAKFVTRDEVYYYVTETIGTGGGTIIYHDVHSGGMCPLIPAPGIHTDSGSPGAEFASPMESVFALTPIVNQIETLLTNIATWNGLGRYVIEDVDGAIGFDDEGNPLLMSAEEMIGLDPQDISVVKGRVRQLTNDSGPFLMDLLQFYTSRLDLSKPSPVTEGQAGASAAAWQVRQLLEASGELLGQPVDNHAAAVESVMRLWIRWMRMLDEPIYAFAAPRNRKGPELRGLIEFDPKDLVETISVTQSPQSAQERVVLRQAGIEMLQAGRIDEHEFYENYDLNPDPEEAIIRAKAQLAVDIAMQGGSDQVAPDSLIMDVVNAVRGSMDMWLLDNSPAFALQRAEQMALSTATQAAGGNVAEAAGARQPAIGASTDIPGTPMTKSPENA